MPEDTPRTTANNKAPATGSSSYAQAIPQPEPGTCQVLLVRHGQSQPFVPDQPFELRDGHGDPHLTELGHHQASLLADRLGREPVAAIYVSSLTRTQQTAAPLAAGLGLNPVVEPDLREVYLGELEGGQLRQASVERHPVYLAMREQRDWGAIPGAETSAELTSRTVAAISRIAERHPDGLVVAVCHGGVIGAVAGHAAGTDGFTFHGSRHTAISHLAIGPAGWVVRSFNDAAHAGSVLADHQLGTSQSRQRPANPPRRGSVPPDTT